MEIRRATIADLPAAARLCQEALLGERRSPWRGVPLDVQVNVRQRLWRSTGQWLDGLLVAMDGDRLVGAASIDTAENARRRFAWRHVPALTPLGPWLMVRFVTEWLLTDEALAPDEAKYSNLAIAPEYRRQGLARALNTAREEEARRCGKRIVTGAVRRDNHPSLELHRRMGYRLIEPPRRRGLRGLVLPRPAVVLLEKELQSTG